MGSKEPNDGYGKPAPVVVRDLAMPRPAPLARAFGVINLLMRLHPKRSVAVTSRFAGIGSVKALIVLGGAVTVASLAGCGPGRSDPV